jgi:hypothetical protein
MSDTLDSVMRAWPEMVLTSFDRRSERADAMVGKVNGSLLGCRNAEVNSEA